VAQNAHVGLSPPVAAIRRSAGQAALARWLRPDGSALRFILQLVRWIARARAAIPCSGRYIPCSGENKSLFEQGIRVQHAEIAA
jgi:hypothetical protein